MKPIEICHYLGQGHIDAYYDELSGKEVRAVLKAGECSANVPATSYTQAARRRAWRKRFDAEFAAGNDNLALALLLEWLMRHHRQLLIDYLDHLGVKHTAGETDEDFCVTHTPEQLRAAATALGTKYPPSQVSTYLLLVGHLQDTPVYDQTPEILKGIGMPDDAIAPYIEHHQKTYKPKMQRPQQPMAAAS